MHDVRSDGDAILRLDNVNKHYRRARSGQADIIHAAKDVSFELERGQMASLVGASGCGKSTVLKMIAGLIPPTGGEITLRGEALTGPNEHIGIMFQQPTLLPWRSVMENVLLPIEIREGRNAANAARERATQLLEMAGLAEFANAVPAELSGGMAQRAAICRMLVTQPEILLLDEPFGALDEFTREQMNVEFERICRSREATAIIVTHSIQEAIFLADSVFVMSPRPGRIVKRIDIDLPRPRTPDMITGNRFNEYVREIHDLLFGSGEGASHD
ncbi:ABC transporter ATP-binding protein [Nitratireductor aquimarinus]|uniref:ABC transporter ATP-binding protein n=1 Tax=Nitratireductor aquimarinus TaxID=889300 RepID=A0ABU4ALX9_9HYPH|nr:MULTISPECIES: ABC transporter ATP-binding protein [Alphaproteobacteria]MBY6023363.1 ABC transporter ATP-binding protein [Nitratireductor sp. DP7N14-4]MBN7758569.1 ABC transporter ATP-binding protein [Nitratireductor aquimarinus]MBY6001331.1 ABC transporter ATP-binding protein [Tritonibacter mobilis]MCV0381451.1 ABC transporter ATP-binding protein [Nitratireductor sp.]MDV6227249.1 ABC transporter ATP-binding protein [Nitratireductor aquimarinus]